MRGDIKLDTNETLKGVQTSVFKVSKEKALQLYDQCKSVSKVILKKGIKV